MATAKREGGLYFVNGRAVDANGEPVTDAPKHTPDTPPDQQPGATGGATSEERLAVAVGAAVAAAMSGKVPANVDARTGAGTATEPVELPTLADLPDHLAGLSTVAEVKALQKTDERKGAVAMYESRLAELEG